MHSLHESLGHNSRGNQADYSLFMAIFVSYRLLMVFWFPSAPGEIFRRQYKDHGKVYRSVKYINMFLLFFTQHTLICFTQHTLIWWSIHCVFQITGEWTFCSTASSGWHQKKYQSVTLLALCEGNLPSPSTISSNPESIFRPSYHHCVRLTVVLFLWVFRHTQQGILLCCIIPRTEYQSNMNTLS